MPTYPAESECAYTGSHILPIIPGARRSSFQDPKCLTASLPEYTGPKTKAAILASGLVKIVKTPAEVRARIDAAGSDGWKVWQSDRFSSVRTLRADMARALKPVRAPTMPQVTAARSLKAAQNEAKKYGAYVGNRQFTPPHEMSAKQLRQALDREAKRLAGLDDDTAFEVVTDLVEAA